MTFAPYTPATLDRIRKLAATSSAADIARDLGWDLGRLRESCRRHGIRLLVCPRGAEPPPPTEAIFPVWNNLRGELSCRGNVLVLRGRQAQVFSSLWRGRRTGQLLTQQELGNGSRSGIGPIVHDLNSKIAPFGLVVRHSRDVKGGYRLEKAEVVAAGARHG